MEAKKALYISQEIHPYLPETPVSNVCRNVPQDIQERGYEVRTFMPKYGCINERRNQLHEVIRLSGVNIPIDDNDHPLIIKVATLQPSRMQVYFIDNDDFFMRGATSQLEIDSSPEDNDERIIFFALGVMETARKLRWYPSIIHCTGWITSVVPALIKTKYAGDPAVMNGKVIFTLLANPFEGTLDPRMLDKLVQTGIPRDALKSIDNTPIDFKALCKLGIDHADAIVEGMDGIDNEILEYAKASGKPFLPFVNTDKDSYADFYEKVVSK